MFAFRVNGVPAHSVGALLNEELLREGDAFYKVHPDSECLEISIWADRESEAREKLKMACDSALEQLAALAEGLPKSKAAVPDVHVSAAQSSSALLTKCTGRTGL